MGITFSVIAILLVLFGFARLNIGKEKYATPCFSIAASKLSGVFEKSANIVNIEVADDAPSLTIKEVWIEKIVERYQSIPIRKGFAGSRLCVRIDAADSSDWTQLVWSEFCNEKWQLINPRGMSVSRDKWVLFCDVAQLSSTAGELEFSLELKPNQKLLKFKVQFEDR